MTGLRPDAARAVVANVVWVATGNGSLAACVAGVVCRIQIGEDARDRAVGGVVAVADRCGTAESQGSRGSIGRVAHAEYYDQYTSPLPKRRYLALARAGAFPCAPVGKQRLVRRSDLHAYIANQAVHLVPRTRSERSDDADEILERVGLRRVKP